MSLMTLAKSLKYGVLVILCGAVLFGQQPQAAPAESPPSGQPSSQPKTDYLQKAAESSIFIYDGTTRPCDENPAGTVLLPLGSGFVAGITDKSAQPKAGEWIGWKILITAGHVIHASRGAIVVRLNRAAPNSGFICFPIPLIYEGKDRNVFTLKDEDAADVASVVLPQMPGTDPTVFGVSMLLDRETMVKNGIKVGTNVFTVGYFWGYSGQRQNYPITKFGKISILTPERWFFNPVWKRYEEAYVVELQNTPGLSGAPVMTYGMEFEVPFRYRDLPPLVVGIVKALTVAPVPTDGGVFPISQGIATVEPASHVRELLSSVADELRKGGANVALD